jgi:cytoskeletal protein CcmA (bactofilin family)
MWEKRKQDELAPKPPSVASGAAEHAQERGHSAPAPVTATLPEAPRSTAVIGTGMTIKGEVHSQEDLYVDGDVEGALELKEHCLTIGPNGKALSDIKAREVVVLGTIHGNVEARDKIAIRKNGKLVGDIKTAGIIIDDGAYFKGSIDIVRTEIKTGSAKKEEKKEEKAMSASASASASESSATAVGKR